MGNPYRGVGLKLIENIDVLVYMCVFARTFYVCAREKECMKWRGVRK